MEENQFISKSEIMKYLIVFAGGGLGSVLRFLTGKFFVSGADKFPWATLTVNTCSSFILGLLAAYSLQKPQDNLWLFLAIGFCGGLSTFSAFTLEIFQLMKSGMMGIALLNVLVNVIVCLIFLWLGFTLVKN